MTTVARECGFATASAFIGVFRRSLGHTPGPSCAAEGGPGGRPEPIAARFEACLILPACPG
ncbi:hypothetical protein AB0F91_27880 [Amycolatopsis sp. NPDC023774]|uniref:hypothetical protein n=1 Tax=Amycolatopsis sp. NPDC023774 TaxID=3155015 RepID=UPI0033EED8C3